MNKIDIIGGNGYLGHGLAKFLTKRNIFFRNISREENSIKNSISFENWLIHKSNNTCIYLADPSYVNAFDNDKYHKAIERFDQSIINTQKTFVYLSSSKIYRKKSIGTYTEDSPKSNKTLYQKLKIRNEQKLINDFENSKRRYIILRIPPVFNEVPKKDTLLEKIINTNLKSELFLEYDYSFYQEFLYAFDLFNLIIKLIKKNSESLILNLSSSELVNIMDLITPKFRYNSFPRPIAKLDNSKLLSLMNYNFHIPSYSIEDNSIYWIKS